MWRIILYKDPEARMLWTENKHQACLEIGICECDNVMGNLQSRREMSV